MVGNGCSILATCIVTLLMTVMAADAFNMEDCNNVDICMGYDDGTETYCPGIPCRDTWTSGCLCMSQGRCVNIVQIGITSYNAWTGPSYESDVYVENITSLEGCDHLTLGYNSEEKNSMCHSLCDGLLSYPRTPECATGSSIDEMKVYYLPDDPCADRQAGTCDLATNAGGLLTCGESVQRVYSYCNVGETDTTGIGARCDAIDHKGDLHAGPVIITNSSNLCEPENITSTYYFFTKTDNLCGVSLRVNYHGRTAGAGEVAMCGAGSVIQPGESSSYSEVYSALAEDCTGLLVELTSPVPVNDLQTGCSEVCASTGTSTNTGTSTGSNGEWAPAASNEESQSATPSCATTILPYHRAWLLQVITPGTIGCMLGLFLLIRQIWPDAARVWSMMC
ncbi:hypothetical protein ACHAWX_000545 [Stephanocyclus meneghinianus]